MGEPLVWQRLLQDIYPGLTVSAADELRDWSESRVVKLSAAVADGSPLTLFAKLDRSNDRRELTVYRAATRLAGFPAPQAGFVTGPGGVEWLIIRAARGTHLHDLSPADWVTACRSLAAYHEQAQRADWLTGIGNLPAVRSRLNELPWPILAATERCAGNRQYTGVDHTLLAATGRSLSAFWPAIATDIAAYPVTLLHGDSHSGNLFLSPDGSIELIDWAGAQAGPGLSDVIGLFDTAVRMHEDCPRTEALEAYRNRLSPDSLRQYGDFGRACESLSVMRALTELEWFAASGDDYGDRANLELGKIATGLEELRR